MSRSTWKRRVTFPDGKHKVDVNAIGVNGQHRWPADWPCVEARAGDPGDIIASREDWPCVEARADGARGDIVDSREDEDAAIVAAMACAGMATIMMMMMMMMTMMVMGQQ